MKTCLSDFYTGGTDPADPCDSDDVCPHRLCGGAEVCDGQPGPAGSHTHTSVLSLPPDQAAQPEDLTAPPAPPSPPLSLPRSLVVPQSWAHHGRMLLQTQTR